MFVECLEDPQAITAATIADCFWTFGTAEGTLFARNVVLSQSGRFLHYSSPNERRWRLEDGEVLLIAEDGAVSARLKPVRSHIPGRLRLEGEHCIGGPSGIWLALQETGLEYPVYFHWSKTREDYLASIPIYLTIPFRTNGVYAEGQLINIRSEALVEPYATLPFASFISVGAFSYCNGGFPSGTATIGRYCSIAAGAHPFGPSHPMERISSAVFSYDPYYVDIAKRLGVDDYALEPFEQDAGEVRIGHDVWIGEDVMIKGGVSIGIGCVLAARSVVTRDVADYSIVAGMPARMLRQRFAPPIVDGLLASQWWTYKFCDLPRSFSRPEQFLIDLQSRVGEGTIQAWEPAKIDIARELLRIPD